MSTSYSPTQQNASAYEHYLRTNWDSLSPYEQEEARAYLHSKFQSAPVGATVSTALGWTVRAGYVCCALALLFFPIVFGPAGFGLGIYNAAKGRAGHGTAQIVLSFFCSVIGFILGMIVWAAI